MMRRASQAQLLPTSRNGPSKHARSSARGVHLFDLPANRADPACGRVSAPHAPTTLRALAASAFSGRALDWVSPVVKEVAGAEASEARRPAAGACAGNPQGRQASSPQVLLLLPGTNRGGRLQERGPATPLRFRQSEDQKPQSHRRLPQAPTTGRARDQTGTRDGPPALHRRITGSPDSLTLTPPRIDAPADTQEAGFPCEGPGRLPRARDRPRRDHPGGRRRRHFDRRGRVLERGRAANGLAARVERPPGLLSARGLILRLRLRRLARFSRGRILLWPLR